MNGHDLPKGPTIGWRNAMGLTLACLGAAMSGCGGPPSEFSPVSGVITYADSPVTSGTIAFYPLAGGRPARSKIGPEGRYQLTTMESGDGARPGEYRVAINSSDIEILADGVYGRTTWLVPERYSNAETSGLEATVTGETIDFDLPSDE